MAVNTLTLISEWSMDGASGDLNGGFRSPVDIFEMVGEQTPPPSSTSERPPVHKESPLLVKRAGEDEWQRFS
jgi:hypothetical protein